MKHARLIYTVFPKIQADIEADAKKYYWPIKKLLFKNPQFLHNLYETG